jgi:hypothetical protein
VHLFKTVNAMLFRKKTENEKKKKKKDEEEVKHM